MTNFNLNTEGCLPTAQKVLRIFKHQRADKVLSVLGVCVVYCLVKATEKEREEVLNLFNTYLRMIGKERPDVLQ